MYISLMSKFEKLPEEVLKNENDTFRAMKYKINPNIYFQAMQHATDICDKTNMNRRGVEVLEVAFKYNNDTMANPRYVLSVISIFIYIYSISL